MQIDHVQLAMPPGKEDAARAFFVEILGMEEEEKPEPLASRGGCWFRKGSSIVHLGVEKEFRPQKKAHPAFLISELDALAATLANQAYTVDWDTALPDRKRFYTHDPFGNRIEFIQMGDGFSNRARY